MFFAVVSKPSLVAARRLIHTTKPVNKTVTEKVSEVADKVSSNVFDVLISRIQHHQINKKVGQGLASAIETGEKVTESAKQTMSRFPTFHIIYNKLTGPS